MRKSFSLVLAVGALAVAGCGGDDNDTDSTAPSPATSETQTAAPTSGDAVVIHMKDLAFSPDAATVKAGEAVKWVNDEDTPHNVVGQGDEFKSDVFGKGESFEVVADKPGEISYVCTLHPGMDGTLTVE